MTGFVSVYVTAGSAEEAERIARTLVEERLAACVNLLGGIVSIYRWGGAVQRDAEVAFIAKTRRELFDALAARVRALHGYEVPCIVAWPIDSGDAAYLDWIAAETRG
jgi:periplasmic divalent cation tolerance protein